MSSERSGTGSWTRPLAAALVLWLLLGSPLTGAQVGEDDQFRQVKVEVD